MLWLLLRSLQRAPRRLILAAVGVAFPVALLGATLLFVDVAVHSMTRVALEPVQVEMRALATSLDTDMTKVSTQLATVNGVKRVERFAAATVLVSTPGNPAPVSARLFAVDPAYLNNHPWVRVDHGLDGGALLTQPLRAAPGFASASVVSIDFPGDGTEENPARSVPLPVHGSADLRAADTWYAIPLGEVQGDIAVVPRSIVIDYGTFERSLLPILKRTAGTSGAQVFNQGNADLPPVTLEAHIAVDHAAYPTDPAQAVRWSDQLRRVLERQTPGSIVVADNAAEFLSLAQADATNAKILFLLLGIPGALVAAGLGLAAASALAEAQRREEALLQLRGATGGQLVALTAGHAAVAGVLGSALGLVVAGAAVSAVTGRPVWRDIPTDRLVVSALVAVGAGILMITVRLISLVRSSRKAEVVAERRLLERQWVPTWRRARLDLIAIAVGVAILGINLLAGGLRQTPIEGETLALAFYVLLAPIALWFGVTLLMIRGILALLANRTLPERARPLNSWARTTMRWLGRRPARTAVALVLGSLAVAFGTNVVTFASTYQAAQRADTVAAIGTDMRITPPVDVPATQNPFGPEIAVSSPVRVIPARVGSDRKSIMTIDPASFRRVMNVSPQILAGQGVQGLVQNPTGVLVAKEIASLFSVGPGDILTTTVFPDDQSRAKNISLKVVGVFRSFPPTQPHTEMVMATGVLPAPLPPPDFYLAKVAPGQVVSEVADTLRGGNVATSYTVRTVADQILLEQRSLTALDLRGLSQLESYAAALVAAVGVAVLGAFLVLERRRETAVLRAVGGTNAQMLTGPALEGTLAVIGSLLIGIPVGIGLSILGIRVLGLFFTLPPPLLVLPKGALFQIAALMIITSALAMAVALRAVTRRAAASVLREP
jgi:putative ABC transport system permease protein